MAAGAAAGHPQGPGVLGGGQAADGGTGPAEGDLHAAPGEGVPACRPGVIQREAEEDIVGGGAGHRVPGEGHRTGGRARARQAGGRQGLEAVRAHPLAAAVGARGGAAGIGGAYKQAPVAIGGGQAAQGGQGAVAAERDRHRGGGAGGHGRAAALIQGQPAGLVGARGGVVPGFKHFDRVAAGAGHRLPAQLQRGGAGLRTGRLRRSGRQAAHQRREGGRARAVPRRRAGLQPVLVGAVGTHRGIGVGQRRRRQGGRQLAPGRFPRLPPQAVAGHRPAGGGRAPAQGHLPLGGGRLEVPGAAGGLRQRRRGARHCHRGGGQPIGAGGTFPEAQHPVPAAAGALRRHVQDLGGILHTPGMRHRRRGGRPGVRRQRIGRRGQQRQLRPGLPLRRHGGIPHPHRTAARHPVVVDRIRRQPTVTPGHVRGAAVRQHLRPHARQPIRRPFDAVARQRLRARIHGCRPAQLHGAVGPGGRPQIGGRPGWARRRRRGHTDGRRAGTRSRRRERLHPVLVGRARPHRSIRMGEHIRRQVRAQPREVRFARLPPQAVPRHRAAAGGRRPAQSHTRVGGGGRGEVPRHARHLGQSGRGPSHGNRTGGQPVGTAGTMTEAQTAIPAAPAGALRHHIEGEGGVMCTPGMRRRRRGGRPLVRRQRIGGTGPQRQLRARGARGGSRRDSQLGRVPARHPVVVHRGRRQAGVRPSHVGGARVGHHLRPHPRRHVR